MVPPPFTDCQEHYLGLPPALLAPPVLMHFSQSSVESVLWVLTNAWSCSHTRISQAVEWFVTLPANFLHPFGPPLLPHMDLGIHWSLFCACCFAFSRKPCNMYRTCFSVWLSLSILHLRLTGSLSFITESIVLMFVCVFSCWVMSDSSPPHGRQHTRLLCSALSPRVCSNSCPLSQWCHAIISSLRSECF